MYKYIYKVGSCREGGGDSNVTVRDYGYVDPTVN